MLHVHSYSYSVVKKFEKSFYDYVSLQTVDIYGQKTFVQDLEQWIYCFLWTDFICKDISNA